MLQWWAQNCCPPYSKKDANVMGRVCCRQQCIFISEGCTAVENSLNSHQLSIRQTLLPPQRKDLNRRHRELTVCHTRQPQGARCCCHNKVRDRAGMKTMSTRSNTATSLLWCLELYPTQDCAYIYNILFCSLKITH